MWIIISNKRLSLHYIYFLYVVFIIHFLILLFVWETKRDRERASELPSTGSLSKSPEWVIKSGSPMEVQKANVLDNLGAKDISKYSKKKFQCLQKFLGILPHSHNKSINLIEWYLLGIFATELFKVITTMSMMRNYIHSLNILYKHNLGCIDTHTVEIKRSMWMMYICKTTDDAKFRLLNWILGNMSN